MCCYHSLPWCSISTQKDIENNPAQSSEIISNPSTVVSTLQSKTSVGSVDETPVKQNGYTHYIEQDCDEYGQTEKPLEIIVARL